MRRIAALLLVLVLAAPAVEAGDPDDTLARRAAASPRSLDQIVSSTLGPSHWPLRAEMLLDTQGRLAARVLIAIVHTTKATRSFESWTGYVGTAGWVPHRRVLTDEADVAHAARMLALLGTHRLAISSAVGSSVRNKENPTKPADIVLSAAPAKQEGELRVALLVSYEGVIKGVAWNPERPAFQPMARPGHTEPIKPIVRILPPLKVPGGAWFNIAGEPTPESWVGKPLLVVTTDPG